MEGFVGTMRRDGFVALMVVASPLAFCAAPRLGAEELAANARTLAFPGAEGFGRYALGGRHGKVLFVTKLDDYLPGDEQPVRGSLRAACDAEGPRIVVFRVSGAIPLKIALDITKPYITIAGQSAPGEGICLKNHETTIRAHDVIVRYVRFRPGDELGPAYKKRGKSFQPDALSMGVPSRDVILDHCSTSWAIDEALSVSGEGITNVTVQWCIISESLNRSYHQKGPHGYGSLLRCNGNITFHHNVYAHHSSRSPRPGTYGKGSIMLDFRNNLIYNSYGYTAKDPARINYIGNYIKRPTGYAFRVGGEATQMYVEGNYLAGGGDANRDNWNLISRAKECNKMKKAYPVAAVKTDSALRAYERILASCGANLPERDAVDARIMDEIRTGKGRIIDSQREVGGWPELKSLPSPKDSDHDGMPDAWEIKHELNPHDASDSAADKDGDGYTNIEEYLNSTNPAR